MANNSCSNVTPPIWCNALQQYFGFAPTLLTNLLDTQVASSWKTGEKCKMYVGSLATLYNIMKTLSRTEREGGGWGVCTVGQAGAHTVYTFLSTTTKNSALL